MAATLRYGSLLRVATCWLALSKALGDGIIPAPVRERLSLATAESNGCEYCLSAHTFLAAKIAKLDTEEIERARHADSSDPHTAARLALSDAIARGHGTTDEITLKSARAAGVTDAEIAEVVGNLALNILTNYFNNLADTDTDTDTDNEYPPVRPHAHS
ncbi:carboxymuconolactone decarboxylase family protein [Streptomyces humicola]|uniref:carboxymuconolactone decarboxylase family protein n=1 Tax=Streptomyces humicola TaxID=2953240 RepID=UPI0022B2739D|nr:carboxymuconolactone decarboxylase family protein [Streptomyces humicola]